MSGFDFDVDSAIEELESLARRVPEAAPKAVKAMAKALESRLKDEVPEDTGELKRAIGKTGVRKSKKGDPYQVVFIRDRGKDDRNVHKALALEYGNSRQAADPFWRQTVRASENEMYDAAKDVMEKAVEAAKK